MSYLNQNIARLALGRFLKRLEDPTAEDPYVDAGNRDLLGEDENGYLFAPRAGSDDYWEPFDHRKPGHWGAWVKTRKTGSVAFLELTPREASE